MRVLQSLCTLLLIAGVLGGCSEQGPPTSPLQSADQLTEAQNMAPGASAQNRAMRTTSDVYTFVPEEPVAGASARLVRTSSGVSYNLRTSGLHPGHAISIWWVIFNNPEACDGECGIEDLFVDFPNDLTPNPEVDPAVMSGGGNVVGGSGRAGFAGHLNEGRITNEHPL